MVGISILLDNGRLRLPMVSSEARSGIVVAPIAKIVELQLAAIGKNALARGHPCPDVLSLRIGCHPKKVHVTQAVAIPSLVHYAGIILCRHVALEHLAIP